MLSKESKIRVLENFYALDYVFFGKPVAQVESCCPLVKEEFLSIKGALLSVFVEMLKLVDHKPKGLGEQVDAPLLMQGARKSAVRARENAQRIVSTTKSRASIKETLKNKIKEDKKIDLSEEIEAQIRQQAFGLAVDNLLLARVVSESAKFDKLNDWEGTIIEDSYKILRDNLIESAYEILYSEGEEMEDEKDKEEDLEEGMMGNIAIGALAGIILPIPGGALAGGLGAAALTKIQQWRVKNQRRLQKFCSGKSKTGSPEYKQCLAAGNAVMKKELQKAKK